MRRIKSCILIFLATLILLSGCEAKALSDPTAWELYSTSKSAFKDCGNAFYVDAQYRVRNGCEPDDPEHTYYWKYDITYKRNGWDAYKGSLNLDTDEVIESTYLGGLGGTRYINDSIGKNTLKVKKNYLFRNFFHISYFLPNLTEKYLEGVEVEKTEDGFSFEIAPDDDMLKTFPANSHFWLNEEDYFRDSSSMTLHFDKNGIIQNVELHVVVKSVTYLDPTTDELYNYRNTVDYSWTFVNPGVAPEILPPEDAENYVPDIQSEFSDDASAL